jgi:CubicO group peptidase (beta-lactamase class C family)
MDALRTIDGWDVEFAAAGVVGRDGVLGAHGDRSRPVPLASVTKIVSTLAVLVAAEEGTVALDEPAGPPGSTVRHLLAHASGLPFEGVRPLRPVGERRIYSSESFRVLAELVSERAGMSFAAYARAAVAAPLGLALDTSGDPGAGMHGSLDDLLRLGQELLAPRLVAAETLAEATAVQFPGLVGILPGFGRMTPNDWGLGFELRDTKSPHWTGASNAPGTFGHFGRSGTFLWVDPDAELACACVTTRDFGDWAKQAWPALSESVLAETAARGLRA